jgi:8-amino-7-oxononanoate synthase
MKQFAAALQQLEEKSRRRSLRLASGIDFTSNDYLGLSTHPALRDTALTAIENNIPLGAGGARLLSGNKREHEELENFEAKFFNAERALFFSSGFLANYALLATLPARQDTIIFDALVHASMRDGIEASHAQNIKVPHNDLNAYEDALKKATGQKWIAVESVYSMDGDCAPLPELLQLTEKYDALLIIDEAHATGIFGPTGRGLSEGLSHERIVTLHTCGKALGVAGGLVCASADIIDYLINKARPFIYNTAPMPLQAVLVQRALQLIDEEPQRRAELLSLRDHANRVLRAPDSPTQIIPVIIGDNEEALEIAKYLQQQGFDVRAIRPPTVPPNTARLRLSLNLNLTTVDIERLAAHLNPFLQKQAA